MAVATIVDKGGVPVTAVDSGAPVLMVRDSGGFPITLADNATPFILDGAAPPGPLPGGISDLAVLYTTTSTIALAFTDAENATSYEYQLDGGGWVPLDPSKVIDSLPPDTSFDVQVRGVNAEGNGPPSNTVQAQTQPIPVGWQSFTMTAGNTAFGWGYATEPAVSAPFGSIDREPYADATMLGFWEAPDDSRVIVIFAGDVVDQLNGHTFSVDGVPLAVDAPAEYNSGSDWTILFLESHWFEDGVDYEIERVPAIPVADFYMRDGGTGDGLTPETAGDFATVWAAASDGDVIELVGETTVPRAHRWDKSVTITQPRGADDVDPLGTGHTHPARFTHTYALVLQPANVPPSTTLNFLTEVGAGKHPVFENTEIVFRTWPGVGQKWEDVGVDTGVPCGWFVPQDSTASLSLIGCEMFHGYGPDNLPYDPTEKLPEFRSPNPWWYITGSRGEITDTNPGSGTAFRGHGDAEWSLTNTCFRGPVGIRGAFAELIIDGCYIHDLCEFSKINLKQHSNVTITGNWIERMVGDFIRTSADNDVSVFNGKVVVEQNIMLDPIGVSLDSSNPHTDWFQLYATRPAVAEDASILRYIESSNNFWGVTHADSRAYAQGHFYQTSSDHQKNVKAILDAPKIRNVVAIGATQKALATECVRDTYIRNSIFVNPTWWTPVWGNYPAGVSIKREIIDQNTSEVLMSVEDTRGAMLDTIAESFSADTAAMLDGSSVTGLKGSVIPQESMFEDPSVPVGFIKPGVLYEKFRPIGIYAGAGPQYETLHEMVTAELDWSGETPHIGMVDLPEQAASTPVESNLFQLQGGNAGEALACSLPVGVEMQQYGADRSTIVEAWTNTPDCTIGNYAKLRATTPSTGNDIHEITFGGKVFEWFVGTGVPGTPTVFLVNGGARFVDPSAVGAGVTRLDFYGKFRTPLSSTFRPFALSNNGCFLEVLSSGSCRIRVQDSSLTDVVPLTVVPGASFPNNAWAVPVYFSVDHLAQEATLTIGANSHIVPFVTEGSGSFPAARNLILLAGASGGSAPYPVGGQFADLQIYRNGILYKEVSNVATTANEDPWKAGAGSFTQGVP